MANVTGKIALSQNFGQTTTSGIPGDGYKTGVQLNPAFTVNASGTTADKVDLKYTKRLPFVASTAQPLDLTALADDVGGTVAFARIKSLTILFNSTTDAATLTIGQATTLTNAWTALLSNPGTLTIRASTVNTAGTAVANQGMLVATSPNTTSWVVDATHKILLLTPSAHAFTVDIEITGCSA